MKVEFVSVSKKYGEKVAVKDLSFSFSSGEIIGFVGPNGAGKTTTMKLLLGLIFPDEGEIYFDGKKIEDSIPEIRARFGYLPENNSLPEEILAADYLEFNARIRKVKNPTEKIKAIARKLDFVEYLAAPIGNLSKGYRQRLGLANALLSDPEILVLDEPQEGLDPAQRIEIRQLIKELGKERTVLLSTHILPEVAETCERIILINEGKIIEDASVSEVLKRFSTKAYRVKVRGKKAVELFNKDFRAGTIEEVSGDTDEVALIIRSEKDIRENIFDFCVKNSLKLLELSPEATTLEEVFLRLTSKN